jgi:hypothetical protein
MWFAEGRRSYSGPLQAEPAGQSEVQREWLQSGPEPGEALVDTGLSSAADCQKLRWSLGDRQRALFSRLIVQSVERDRALFERGGLEAEARRISSLVEPALKSAGRDTTTFSAPAPEKLSAEAPLLRSPTNYLKPG